MWYGANWRSKCFLWFARNAPRVRGMERAYLTLASALSLERVQIRNKFGTQLLIDPLDFIGHEICSSGSYETSTVALATRLMEQGGVFIDVGANFGLFTFTIASEQNTRCIAVDASPVASMQFRQNLLLNDFGNITFVCAAITSEHQLRFLYTPIDSNLGTTRITCEERLNATLASTTTIDEVLSTLRVSSVELLKIDVEGAELDVLEGTDLRSSVAPKNIIMEYTTGVTPERNLRKIYELLCNAGYQSFTVNGDTYEIGLPLPEANLWWRRNW